METDKYTFRQWLNRTIWQQHRGGGSVWPVTNVSLFNIFLPLSFQLLKAFSALSPSSLHCVNLMNTHILAHLVFYHHCAVFTALLVAPLHITCVCSYSKINGQMAQSHCLNKLHEYRQLMFTVLYLPRIVAIVGTKKLPSLDSHVCVSLSPLTHLKSCEMYICIICYFDLHTDTLWERNFDFKWSLAENRESAWKIFWQFIIEFPLHNLPNLSFPFLTRLLHTYALVIMCMSSMCPKSFKELRQFAKILSLFHANSICYHRLLPQPHAKPSFCILPKMSLDSTMQPLTILSRRFGKIKLRLSFNFSMQFSFLWAFEWKIHFWSWSDE